MEVGYRYIPGIPVLSRLKQEDQEFKASLGNINLRPMLASSDSVLKTKQKPWKSDEIGKFEHS